jgi:hypothetical protein
MPCREAERADIMRFVEEAIAAGEAPFLAGPFTITPAGFPGLPACMAALAFSARRLASDRYSLAQAVSAWGSACMWGRLHAWLHLASQLTNSP